MAAALVPPAQPGASAAAAEWSLWLDRPARRDEVVTTPEVVVRGRVASAVDVVWIVLESSNGKPVATRTIEPTGRPRDGTIPFESRFRLSLHRPAGSIVVLVVAVGTDGVPIDAVRRRFQLGAVVDDRDSATRWRVVSGRARSPAT
jgi:hypothetical protein